MIQSKSNWNNWNIEEDPIKTIYLKIEAFIPLNNSDTINHLKRKLIS
jgi:hypothetical protein